MRSSVSSVPTGRGKTTTVECITGMREPDGGTIEVAGLTPNRQGTELRRRIGVQLQQAALPDRLKVWEALDMYASFYDKPADWRGADAAVGPHREARHPLREPLRRADNSGSSWRSRYSTTRRSCSSTK